MSSEPPKPGGATLAWHQRLNYQLATVISAMVFLSLLILGSVSAGLTQEALLSREFYYLSSLSQTYALHLSQQIDKTRAIVNAYSYDSSLRDALIDEDTRQAFFLLGFAREASAYLEDIVLVRPDGRVLVSGSLRMEGERIDEYPSFLASLESGRSSIGTAAVLSRGLAPSIGISAPVILDGEVIGVLLGVFNLERFGIDVLTSSLTRDQAEVFVIDESRQYVVHPNRRRLLQAVEEEISATLPEASGKTLLMDGERRISALEPVSVLPWYLGVHLDARSVKQPIRRIIIVFFVLSLIIAISLSMSLFYYLRRLIVSPILSMRDRVAEFDRKLEPIVPRLERRNELQLLERQLSLMSSDIAERNRKISAIYRQLLRSEKLASLGALVAGLSHEMNTPLGNAVTLVSNCSQTITDFRDRVGSQNLTRTELDNFIGYIEEAVVHVQLNINRAAGLVRDLKQVAVDQGSMRRREFDLREVTEEVIHTIFHMVKNRPIEITNSVEGDIKLNNYPGPLEQVITNLISNSLAHGFGPEDSGEIQISGKKNGGMVYLEYSDDGIGIPEDLRERVFEPFYSSKIGQGGTGLGLFLVQNIVSGVFNGHIILEAAQPRGVRILIEFPAEPPESPRETLDFLSLSDPSNIL